jgi:1,4-dihydroxy-2-naphthoate octaprenyltransferase
MTCLALVVVSWPLLFVLAYLLKGSWWWGFLLVIPTPIPIRKVAERFSRHVDRSRTLIHHAATFLAEVGGERPEQPRAVEYTLDRNSLEFP